MGMSDDWRGELGANAGSQIGQTREGLAGRLRITGRGHGHKAAHGHVGQGGHCAHELGSLGRRHPALRRLARHVHLDVPIPI